MAQTRRQTGWTSFSSYGYMKMLNFDRPIFNSSKEISPLQLDALDAKAIKGKRSYE
jgi:hypothetical protein